MSLGQTIRCAREAQERSLEQVYAGTRISVKLLAAIEKDDLTQFSSAFLYRSFVRQVAEYLHLDFSTLDPMVQDASTHIPKALVPGEIPSNAPRVAALQMGRRRGSRWVQSISSLTVALVACSGIYALWQNSKANHTSVWPRIAMLDYQAQPAPPLPEAPLPSRVLTLPSVSPLAAENGFTLELSATEPAWLSIIADGRVSFKGILERSETKILAGHQSARIRTGNAGAVEAIFNGRSIGTLGSPGQVRTVLFTRNDYQVLDAPVRISFLDLNPTGVPMQLLLPAQLAFPIPALPHS